MTMASGEALKPAFSTLWVLINLASRVKRKNGVLVGNSLVSQLQFCWEKSTMRSSMSEPTTARR